MNKKILVDIGENFEYVRTIVENKVELAKLDLAEFLTKILSKLVLFIVVGFFASIILVGGLISMAVWLSGVFDSIFIGIGLVCVFLFILAIIVLVFRKALIISPITTAILDTLELDD